MSLAKHTDRVVRSAVVINVHKDSVDVRAAGSPKLLRGLPVVGGTEGITPGSAVLLTVEGGQMYAHTTQSRRGPRNVIMGGGGMVAGGGGMSPHPMDYHTDARPWHAGLSGNDLHDPKAHAMALHTDAEPWHAGLLGNDLHDPKAHAASHYLAGSDTVDHDLLGNYVANEHIDHTGVTLTAGHGLTGGGTIDASRDFAVDVPEIIDTDYGLEEFAGEIRVSLNTSYGLLFHGGEIRTHINQTLGLRYMENGSIATKVGGGLNFDQQGAIQVLVGDGLVLDATIALGTPSTLDTYSSNGVTEGSHTHDVDATHNPGGSRSLLRTDINGKLYLAELGADYASIDHLVVSLLEATVIDVMGTPNNAWTIHADNPAEGVDTHLIMEHFNGQAYLSWNGDLMTTNRALRAADLGISRISAAEPESPFAGQVWLQP